MSTKWPEVEDSYSNAFGLRVEPGRNYNWYLTNQEKRPLEPVKALIHANQKASISNVVAGHYWSRKSADVLSYTSLRISLATARSLRKIGFERPAGALNAEIGKLIQMGLSRASVKELLAMACLPPRGVAVPWLSIGECIHMVMPEQVMRMPYISVAALMPEHATLRFLQSNGISSIARLLLSQPLHLISLRGVGPTMFCKIIGLLTSSVPGTSTLSGQVGYKEIPDEPLSSWFQINRVRLSRSLESSAALSLLEGAEDQHALGLQLNQVSLLNLSESTIARHGVSASGYMRALGILTGALPTPINSNAAIA